MERVKIYRIKKQSIKYILIIGAILLFSSVMFSLRFIIQGIDGLFLPMNMIFLPLTSLGFLLIIFGYLALKNDKYFFEWNDSELTYLLPGQALIENIKIADIKDISIQAFFIKIKLSDSEKILNLANIEFAEFHKIKEMLEGIGK